MCRDETLDTHSLEEITKRLEDLLKPMVEGVLARQPLAQATDAVKEAMLALQSLSPNVSFDGEDEVAASESLTAYLKSNLAQSHPGVQEKVLHHHVVEAADIVATTWLDILYQGCTEAEDGRLLLDGDSMLPTATTHPDMHELILEAVQSSVISEKEFRRALCALRQDLFAGGSSVELPLELRIQSDRARLVAERRTEG